MKYINQTKGKTKDAEDLHIETKKKRTENWKLILTNSKTKLQVMKVLKETLQSRPAKKLIEGLTIPAIGYFYQQFSK